MFTKLTSSAALKRIGLSAVKAFAATAVAYVVAHQADLTGGTTALKGVAFAAVVAGFDAAFKAVQVATEAPAPAVVAVVPAVPVTPTPPTTPPVA